ncbi:MAG: aldehyde dehydrogenase family protein [Methanimicrococcus sp.]|nr:aldehyde dehydrogenase family protein [Methanimicrococcus sp.]
MYINGERYVPHGAKMISVINPATGEVVETVPSASPADVGKAVSSCADAFLVWSQKSYAERSMILSRVSAMLAENRQFEKLAALLTTEQGKPLHESRREIEGVIAVINHFTGLSSSLNTDFFENKSNNSYSFTLKKPLGVCASILPWNMPALILSWKIIPALLTGNTCLVKPSSICPLTVLELAAVFSAGGLPPGVFNAVTGPGEEIGEQLAQSKDIKRISFTGSAEAGRKMYEAAAKTAKKITLELGGSDAMIVCDDADIEDCSAKAVAAKFFNCGQACVSPKRIFVFESVYDSFVTAALKHVSQIRLGNGLSGTATMGPLSCEESRKKIIGFVEAAQKEGAEILCGGKIPAGVAGVAGVEGAEFEKGCFFEPTVIVNVPKESRLLKEEVFGPVMVILPVKDLDEAIAKANNSDFGLGASVWTNDIRRAKKAAEELEAGVVWVNQHAKVLPELPFGGVKDSGLGRENGYEVLNDYLETKAVVFKF